MCFHIISNFHFKILKDKNYRNVLGVLSEFLVSIYILLNFEYNKHIHIIYKAGLELLGASFD